MSSDINLESVKKLVYDFYIWHCGYFLSEDSYYLMMACKGRNML
jgi:hypothetical protein